MAWVFRSNDAMQNLLEGESSADWPVRQHAGLINAGDLVFLWEDGTNGAVRAVGKVLTQVHRSERDLRRQIVRVGHHKVLDHPLTADECREEAVLRELPVLKRGDQANYGLSKAQANRLLSIIAGREQGLAEALDLPPDAIHAEEQEHVPASAPEYAEPQPPPDPWGSLDADDIRKRMERFVAEPKNRRKLVLQHLAHVRMATFLVPDRLAEATAAELDEQLAQFGSVMVHGRALELDEAARELKGHTTDDISEMARRGLVTTSGTLTWQGPKPGLGVAMENHATGTEGAAALRLRAALAHLLNDGRPINSRLDRARRSAEPLWPEVATGILMVLDPNGHCVFSEQMRAGLGALRLPVPPATTDGYAEFLSAMSRLADITGAADMVELGLFLSTVSESEQSADEQEPLSDTHAQKHGVPAEIDVTPESPEPRIVPNEGQAVFLLYQHLRSRGVIVSLEQLINIYLSLKAVPTAVLGGPSGVGKHTITRNMAALMGASYYSLPMSSELGTGPSADEMVRFRDLLGKLDPRTGYYRPEPWYDAILYAHENPEEAVVLAVDTVSEWREDYWFSEYLRLQDGNVELADGTRLHSNIVAAPGKAELSTEDGRTVPGEFTMPDNLFMVMTTVPGVLPTVLVSERVNFIELEPADLSLSALTPGHPPEGDSPDSLGNILVESRAIRSISDILDREWVGEWNDEIERLNDILQESSLAIGYRLRDDMLRYLGYADNLNHTLPYGTSFPLEVAFDYQITQRILPPIAEELLTDELVTDLASYARGRAAGQARFPLAFAKLERLEAGLE